jgi:hypothetical protein
LPAVDTLHRDATRQNRPKSGANLPVTTGGTQRLPARPKASVFWGNNRGAGKTVE